MATLNELLNKTEDILEKMENYVDFTNMDFQDVIIILREIENGLGAIQDENIRKEMSELIHESLGKLQNKMPENWAMEVNANMQQLKTMIENQM